MAGALMTLVALLVPNGVHAQQDAVKRCQILLNNGWLFERGDLVGAQDVSYDDSQWQKVNLPHDFQISQPWVEPSADERADNSDMGANVRSRLSARGFKEMGKGWYRLHLTPADSLAGRRLVLEFEGMMYVGDVYVNGQLAGQTNYGYVGFGIDVTKLLKVGKENVIAVMTDTREPQNSRWYTGGGINRNVHLVATDAQKYFTRNPLYITTKDNEWVNIQFESASFGSNPDSVSVRVRITDPSGAVVNDHIEVIRRNRKLRVQELRLQPIAIPKAKLWDCENPNLYTAELTLLREDGSVVDRVQEHFGVRTVEFTPDHGLLLNGKKVILKGIANHHTLGALGAAAYDKAIEKRIALFKSFGLNHIRTSHNPYSKSLLDLCDRHGILVVDELYDKWLDQYCGGREPWLNLWQHDVPEFIKRDRNHPSVVLWSLGNELQTYNNLPFDDWGVTPYRLQRELVMRYDSTRLTTVAMHPRGRNHFTDSLPAPLAMVTDVQAYNYRYMYFPGDGRRFPHMMFYQSEATTVAMGPNYYEMDLDKVIGLAWWGLIDYLGESNGWPAKGWDKGVFDISLEPKPKAYLLKSICSDEPMVHIGIEERKGDLMWNGELVGIDGMTDHWNRTEGQKLSIVTYTNAEEVELLVNGKSIGVKKNDVSDPKRRNQIAWKNVVYHAGNIEAVAKTGGKVVARHKIETTGNATKLAIVAEDNSWVANGQDLMHLRVVAQDKKGRRMSQAQDKLTFEVVSGDAQIVAVANGDIYSNESFVGNERSLFNGAAQVILRAGSKPGLVVVKAKTADGKGSLKEATIKLNLK